MDVQLKKGLLDICVLALLSKGESYGYELTCNLSSAVEVSESTLYPILKRLEASGLLATFTREHNGRLRRYYCITTAGRKRLKEFNDDWKELERIHAFIQSNGEGENV